MARVDAFPESAISICVRLVAPAALSFDETIMRVILLPWMDIVFCERIWIYAVRPVILGGVAHPADIIIIQEKSRRRITLAGLIEANI